MPDVIKANPNGTAEKQIALGEVGAGGVFRFPGTTFEEALANEDHAGFFMVFKMTPPKTGRVYVVSLDGAQVLERDEDRLVIVHKATVSVEPAELV